MITALHAVIFIQLQTQNFLMLEWAPTSRLPHYHLKQTISTAIVAMQMFTHNFPILGVGNLKQVIWTVEVLL